MMHGLAMGRASFPGGKPFADSFINPFPALLLIPEAGSLHVQNPSPSRPITGAGNWLWLSRGMTFDIQASPGLHLVWFEIPEDIPGFAPEFAGVNRRIPGQSIAHILLPHSRGKCQLSCGLRDISVFGRSLDLLAHVFHILETPIPETDENRIHLASRLLLDRLLDPPTIPELARLAALNECKLKALFKSQFGFTIHGFVKEHRLLMAKELLESGAMNVGEVAWSVGWENCSHFAKSFHDRFGGLPSRWGHSSSR